MPFKRTTPSLQRHLVATRLRYFDVVRRCKSIREASRQLNVSSSAVSRQLISLEQIIGAPLFERLPTGLKLSAAGEALARYTTSILQDAARTDHELQAVKGGSRGSVTIVAVEGLSMDFLPRVIAQILKRSPLLRINVLTTGSASVGTAVAEGAADIGMAFSLFKVVELRQRAASKFRLGAIVHPKHPLARRRQVSLSECTAYPLILADRQLSIRALLEPHLAHLREVPMVVIEANSIELMKNLASREIGICFLSRLGLERELAQQTLVHVPLVTAFPVVTELGIYVRANRALPVAVEVVLQALGEEAARRAEAEQADVAATAPEPDVDAKATARANNGAWHRRKERR
jgi:DNA-binding transcriptional LysR family regulator